MEFVLDRLRQLVPAGLHQSVQHAARDDLLLRQRRPHVRCPAVQLAVLHAPDSGVYSFTAVNRDPSGKPVAVSTGSFSGGGYQPLPQASRRPRSPRRPLPSRTCWCNSSACRNRRNCSGSEDAGWRILGDDPTIGGWPRPARRRDPRVGHVDQDRRWRSACSRSPAPSNCPGSASPRKVRCRATRCS